MKHLTRVTLLAALCLLAAALAVPALAGSFEEFRTDGEGYTWPAPGPKGYVDFKVDGTTYRRYEDGHVGIYKTEGTIEGFFQIPQAVGDQPVTTVDGYAFKNQDKLTGVVIPEGVTGIGDRAFRGCASLATVSLPASVTDLGKSLFYGIKTPITVYYAGTDPEIIAQMEKLLPKGSTIVSGHVHEITNDVTTPSTCTDAGARVQSCVCGVEMAREVLPALGHDLKVIKEGTPATCTEAGKSDKKKCTRCGETFKAKTIPALGHDWEHWQKIQEPTCTEAGVEQHKCNRCGETESREYGAALSHDWGEWTVTTAPTCTKKGERTCTCKRDGCGETKTKNVSTLGHDWGGWTLITAPTCTGQGEETRTCKRDGCGETNTRRVQTLGHDWGEWTVTTAPTCTDKGEETRTCKRDGCGKTKTREVDMIDHTPVTDPAVEPTCTKSGLSEGSHCSVCGEVLVPQVAILSLGHQVVVDPRKEPTCGKSGLTEGSHCSVCGEVLVAQEVIPATGEHDLVDHAGQAATCTAVGWNAYQTCSRCDYTTHVELPALGHDLVHHDAQTPTCTAVGWDAYDTCSRCDYTSYEEKAALGHTGGTATCMAKAKCAVCGEEYGTLGEHDWDTSAWITDGSKHWHKCKTPGCTATTDEAAHSGGTATCKAKAKCAVCGEEYGTLGEHKYVDQPDTGWEYNITVDGKKYQAWGHYKVCSVCETAKIEVEDGRQEIEDDPSGDSGGSGSGDPAQPSEGGDHVQPSEGGDPVQLSEGGDPVQPSEGGDPVQPSEGGDPVQPSEGSDPVQPSEGGE